MSRIAGEGAASAEVLHGLPGGGPNGGVVIGGVVPERGETVVVGGRKDKGLLGEDREDGGVRGSDGVEQVNGGIATIQIGSYSLFSAVTVLIRPLINESS